MPREPLPPRVLRPRHLPVRDVQDNDTNPQQNQPILTPSLPLIQQNKCFLFTIFPPEIRNRIYAFSLESEDITTTQDQPQTQDQSTSTHHYRQNAFYYRPGHIQPKRIPTNLLQTCQQIYTEASLLPTHINEHTFWFYRGPPHIKNSSSPLEYFRQMSARQRAQVHHIHLFMQQYFLEDSNNLWSSIWEGTILDYPTPHPNHFLRGRGRRGQLNHKEKYSIAPKKLTITFRHTDWWFWENDEPLGIDPFRTGRTRAHEMHHVQQHQHQLNSQLTPESKLAWGNQFTTIPTLSSLTIEFETIMRKRDQLDSIIDQALTWKFPLQPENSVYLVAEPTSRCAYTWVGAKEGDLMRQPPTEEGRAMDAATNNETDTDSKSRGLGKGTVVPVLRAFDARVRDSERAGASQTGVVSDTEEFYVVFLTWKRQVVDG